MEQETMDNTTDSPDQCQDDPLLSLFIDKTGMSGRESISLVYILLQNLIPTGGFQPR